MASPRHLGLIAITVLLLASACAPQALRGDSSASQSAQPTVRKRATAATNGNLVTLSGTLSVGSGMSIQGLEEFGRLVNAGLTIPGLTQAFEPQLAEAVPSVDNGQWRVMPDGRMETIWKIRQTARWHDGVPVTSNDVLFLTRVGQDPELDFVRDPKYKLIDSIEAPDQQTVLVRWKQLYIEADQMFGLNGTLLLPKHVLEEAYAGDKANFLALPFWTSQFVGAGPYKISQWQDGVGAVLTANEGYALGRPKIDEIEVKFIPNSGTLMANILAGSVELTLGRGVSAEQASQLRDQWRDGTVATLPANPNIITPQHLNPSPAIISNPQFRRALMYALDREELGSVLTAGMGIVAHSGLPIDQAIYREVDKTVVKYPYDPRQAVQMIEGLGYTRAPDGVFQDATGEKLAVQVQSSDKDINVRTVLAVADYWKRSGVPTEPVVTPAARQSDLEYQALYPSFDTGGGYGSLKSLIDIKKSEMRLPDNGYRGRNKGNYVNAELENLIERYYVTISQTPRLDTLGQIYRMLTDQVVVMWLYYDVDAFMIANRLANLSPKYFGNVHEWDAKP